MPPLRLDGHDVMTTRSGRNPVNNNRKDKKVETQQQEDTLSGGGQAAGEGDAIAQAGLLAIPYLAIRWAIGKYRKGKKGES